MRKMNFATVMLGLFFLVAVVSAFAEESTEADLKNLDEEFIAVVEKGRALWVDPKLGTNGVTCGQCHPNAANTHPETYPKFQKQIGKVIGLRNMINVCIRNPLKGAELDFDSPEMIALEAYITWEGRGVPLAPGKH